MGQTMPAGTEPIPIVKPPLAVAFLVVTGASLLGTLARAGLALVIDPTNSPYITYFPVLVAATIYGGWVAGLVALLISAVLGTLLWASPVGPLADGVAPLLTFAVSGALCVGLVLHLRTLLLAERTAPASADDQLAGRPRLASSDRVIKPNLLEGKAGE
jgi:hypothetical protein